jgi:hypothetical protein
MPKLLFFQLLKKDQKNTHSTQPNYSFYYLFIKLVIEDLWFFLIYHLYKRENKN